MLTFEKSYYELEGAFVESLEPENVFVEPLELESVFVEPLELENVFVESLELERVFVEPLELESVFVEPLELESVFVEPLELENVFVEPLELECVFVEPLELESVFVEPLELESSFVEPLELESVFVESLEPENAFVEPLELESVFVEPLELESVFTQCGAVFGKVITGDEKCILYENIKRKKSYCKPGTSSATVPKLSIHQRKELLFLWWDRKGSVYYELLKQGETINADLYCNQLDKLNAAIKEKKPALATRKGIVFHHDNALPHTALISAKLSNGKKFKSFESVSKAVADYFNSKDENFYKIGIYKLPERWQQVVANNGAYSIIDFY
ncbi:mariner Mos1 transposase [Trichonephila clavipes]|nr:mariner Mos1 transposase [Trichonephila clavipes]